MREETPAAKSFARLVVSRPRTHAGPCATTLHAKSLFARRTAPLPRMSGRETRAMNSNENNESKKHEQYKL